MKPIDIRGEKPERVFRRNFYHQILVLGLSTALMITAWILVRHAHLETLRSACGWASTYRQIVLLSKTSPKIQDLVSSNLHDDERDALLHELMKDHESFRVYFHQTHGLERSRFPRITQQVTNNIINWIKKVNSFLDAYNGFISDDPIFLAGLVNKAKGPCEEALISIVHEYSDATKRFARTRQDITGYILLSILALLTIIQVLLIRAECIKQSSFIRLAQDLANLIHDVGVPQQVATSAASMLLLPDIEPATVKHLIQAIADSLSAMQRLIDTALLRIKAGDQPVPILLTDILEDISTVHQAACKQKGLIWRCFVAPSAKHFILVDANALIQMLNNLLSNAVRYTDKGAVSLTAHLERIMASRVPLFSSSNKQYTLVITVTDTGCGIPKDSMSLIFQKFKTNGPGMGFGIGLFTVSRLVSNLRGRIDLWSELGKGTRFTITIPVSLTRK